MNDFKERKIIALSRLDLGSFQDAEVGEEGALLGAALGLALARKILLRQGSVPALLAP